MIALRSRKDQLSVVEVHHSVPELDALATALQRRVAAGRFPRLYRRGPKLITIGDRPASQDLALTPVFTDGELPLA